MSYQARKGKSNNARNLSYLTTLEHCFFHQFMLISNQQTVFSDLMNKYKQVPKERKAKNTSFLTPPKKYIMIEEFKDELKSFKNILNEIEKLELLREREIKEIKNDTKRKLNMLDDEISNVSENLDVDLTTLILRCEIFKHFES